MKDLEKKEKEIEIDDIDIDDIKKRSYINIISEDRLWVSEKVSGEGFLCKLVNKNKK